MLYSEAIRGLSIRRTDAGERVSQDRTGKEWSTQEQAKKTLRAGGPDIKEMREFIKYFMTVQVSPRMREQGDPKADG
jgi:hypothetical protein